ncbi:ThiF family adenylyltransferase [Candidatus Woesearchaeota archaeon]|nr:ThiF family adenylyltransferase [Candidatus Woesearchaeota archaeon]
MQDNFSYEVAFSRNIGTLTQEAQQLLRDSCIAIAGVGGTGGTTAEQLVRMGAGYLRIADHDSFEISNLNRQTGALVSTIGRKKTDVLYSHMKDINPDMRVDVFPEGVDLENVVEFLDGADVVVEMVDYFSPDSKLIIHKTARANNQYVISTPSSGFGAVVLCFDPAGPTIEELLRFPDDPDLVRRHRMGAKKLMGGDLEYLPSLYFEKFEQENYPSTVSPAVALAGAVTATQTIKLLIYLEQKKDPARFKEYGQIEITTVPEVLRIDAWDEKHCLIANMEELK